MKCAGFIEDQTVESTVRERAEETRKLQILEIYLYSFKVSSIAPTAILLLTIRVEG